MEIIILLSIGVNVLLLIYYVINSIVRTHFPLRSSMEIVLLSKVESSQYKDCYGEPTKRDLPVIWILDGVYPNNTELE